MTCKGICIRHKAQKPLGHFGRYAAGQKRCQICAIYMRWDGMWCPCCGCRVRTRPRNSKFKQKFKTTRKKHNENKDKDIMDDNIISDINSQLIEKPLQLWYLSKKSLNDKIIN